MTILVTGATGTVGSQVLHGLADKGLPVRALARDPSKLRVPAGVELAKGDMADVSSMREALYGIDTLFLLNAVVPDEATQALLTLDLARDAGIKRFVYLSVVNSGFFDDVPHFAAKHLVERVIDAHALPASVMRANYFMQNDLGFRDVLKAGLYPQPVGTVGVAMVDVRDLADAIVIELTRRERAPHALPRTTIDVAGPDILTGADLATIWSSVLGQEVRYAGDDLDAFETQASAMMPGWKARDLKLMLRGFHRFGLFPGRDGRETLEGVIGHSLRSYRAFAEEAVANW